MSGTITHTHGADATPHTHGEMTAPSGKPTRVDALLGKETDEEWAGRLDNAVVDVLSLDQWEAQKSRLRRTTIGGRELAVSLDRGIQLQDGDILLWDEPANTVVVARINLKDVLEIDLSALVEVTPEKMIQTCLELGHAVGNQHWPAVVKGMKVYVPLTVDKAVMGSVMRTHAFEGIEYTFIPGAEVIPYIAPHEARRLFGAAAREGEGHTHDPLV
ncbi:urease accessory protein UreE [Rhodococcus qingshengii]|uniref:urease accessory protein UreE n=1 Tax=Rhodococcus qingshengii TaxID=334542 RepID=UPI0011EEC0DA|nr:urease accessory protein UreE [Rhodococcus qingshengii]QEM29522.1 urease accessory protein UreE [Rhodococcus qingshengii]WOI89460.1 urease accessory protein UreE [Rhodococcus qingshengii]